MSRFFWAQYMIPTRGDWVSNIKTILDKIDLNVSFEDINESYVLIHKVLMTQSLPQKLLQRKIMKRGGKIHVM